MADSYNMQLLGYLSYQQQTSDNEAVAEEAYDAGADSGDINGDGTLNIMDMLEYINIILNP